MTFNTPEYDYLCSIAGIRSAAIWAFLPELYNNIKLTDGKRNYD